MNSTPNIQSVQPLYNGVGTQVGSILTIDNYFQYGPQTYLSQDSSNSIINYIENGAFFPNGTNTRYLLGSQGTSNAETLSASVITAGTVSVPWSITFGSAPINRHSRGEFIAVLYFDQIEIQSSATLTGVYTTLATIAMQVNSTQTVYIDTASAAPRFYKIRFVNSLNTSTKTPFSDSVGASSYSLGTAGYLIQQVREAIQLDDQDPSITNEFLVNAINEARQIMDREIGSGLMKEWRMKYETPIKMCGGTNYIVLPSDIDFTETNRAVLTARYSNNSVGASLPLSYIDKREWNQATYQRRYTTVATAASIGATSLSVVDGGDFPNGGISVYPTLVQRPATATSGTVAYVVATGLFYVYGSSWNVTTAPTTGTLQVQGDPLNKADPLFNSSSINTSYQYTITYGAYDNVNNIFYGVSGVIRAIPAGYQIWAYQTQAYPLSYTIFKDYNSTGLTGVSSGLPRLWLDSVVPLQLHGLNIYIDYYTAYADIQYLSDTIPEHYRDIYKNYLRFAIKRRRDDTIGMNDVDYQRFLAASTAQFANVYLGQTIRIK